MTREEKIHALKAKEKYELSDLLTVVELLRSPGDCPGDMEQDHKSIRKDLIEETYEVIEAIDTDNSELLLEELGDLLLQIVFHTQIEREAGGFNIGDVADGICSKLIHRHPHVFSDVEADTSDKVLTNWEKIKSEEKQRVTVTDKLRAIPPMLPALMRAEKVGKKASCFDFPDADSVMVKVREELSELEEAVDKGDNVNIEEEMGDLLLTLTSLCRKLKIDPERSLFNATEKFIDRFDAVEKQVISEGYNINELKTEQLDAIWDKNKQKIAKNNKKS